MMDDVIEPPRILAEVVSYADLHHAMRARAEELEVSRQTIDDLAGLQDGYASKLLCDPPVKRLSWDFAAIILPALGLKLALLEDQDALAKLQHRMTRRRGRSVRVALGLSPQDRARALHLEQCRRGGEQRAAKLSARRRSEIARLGAQSLNRKLSSEQRSENARRAGVASGLARQRAKQQACSCVEGMAA